MRINQSEYCLSEPGLSCSKQTALVNVTLKFQTVILIYASIFLLKNCEKLLQASLIDSTKNISVIGYEVVEHLTS